ncbi:MAG: heparinase II/III family protein [Ectothiorhodospiraceae bacterium]|nr:heparinase II/III family protein [Ectothiorhodospiraceae bacterium]
MINPLTVSAQQSANLGARALWYYRRLSVMSAPEMLHRGSQAVTLAVLHLRYRQSIAATRRPMPLPAFCRGSRTILPPLAMDMNNLATMTPALLDGYIRRAGSNWRWSPEDADIWRRAPDSGRLWPGWFFGSIPYRQGNPYGDVRELWEPSRLQHLVDLAQIAATSSGGIRQRAVDLVATQLVSWVECNPHMAGPHYISSMECALRRISACYALDLIRPWLADDAPARQAVAAMAVEHPRLIAQRLSLYSSLGNHTIAEAAGLIHAGALFTDLPEAAGWRSLGLNLLAEEADHQVLADGGGTEQAIAYHHANLQLMALSEQLLIHLRLPGDPRLTAAVERGTHFLDELALPSGELPAIGDSDDGEALSPSLTLCQPRRREQKRASVTTLPYAGYTVLRSGSPRDILLILDHGPLGMPPSHGHGHADALSVLLWVSDVPLLVDTGTFAYAGDPVWRKYFRSTAAHNTVTVDESDQAFQQSGFLWSRPYRAELLSHRTGPDSTELLLARHDGYQARGVSHTRGVAWSPEGWLLVQDVLSGDGMHELALHWHLGVVAEQQQNGALALRLPGGNATMTCTGGYLSLHRGETSPVLGWQSPAYAMRRPITTVRVYHHGELPHRMTTLLLLPGIEVPGRRIEECLQWMTAETH